MQKQIKYATMMQFNYSNHNPNCTQKTFSLTSSGYSALFRYISYLNTLELNNAN